MNLKTTIILAILVALVGAGLLVQTFSSHGNAAGPTVEFLDKDLKPETLTRIEIGKGKVVLEKSGPADWSLPGKWPVRTDETKELVQTLTGLHTRFAPEPLTDNADLKKYGLDHPLVVKVTVAGKEHTLEFGEEPNESNKFSRPTYVRLDDRKDIVRLAPGLVTVLDRPQKDYQLPRLFPYERVAKDNNPLDKVEQVAAKAITIQSPEGTIELTKNGSEWDISAPVKDHADPDKLKALLGAFPEIWAERFIDAKDKKLEDFGLKDPATVLTVTKPSGGTIKLLIGGESDKKLRKVPRPAAPQQPFMPPKEDFDMVQDIYRYAKLEANDQIFEIKADALKDIQLNLAALRDSQLARFRTDAVTRLEIDWPMADSSKKKDPSGTLVFVKDKDRWRMEQPKAGDAETAPIRELLDKLAGLQAKEKDVLDKADLKSLGLDKPEAQIKVTVEDEKGPKDKKTKTSREIVYEIGIQDKDKLYVMVEGWPRVNAVDEALLKLVKRPEMVYRNRHLLDVTVAELGKLEIVRGTEAYAFEQDKGTWKMIAPVKTDVDSAKVAKLAGELAKIEAVEFIADNPKEEDLEKVYGLVPPALTAKLTLADKDKQTVIFLGKPRGDKEFYARQANGPVFVVRKDLFSEIDRDSLVYRPLEILPGLKDKIKELAFQKDGQEFRLVQDGKDWKLRGPFDAPAAADLAEPIADEFAGMKASRFVAHEAKELKEYGLEKPYMTLRLVPAGKDDPEIQLQIGKPVEKKEKEVAKDKDVKDKDKNKDKESADEGGRYAKLSSGPAVFVLSDRTIATFDKGPLDFLDKKMLALDVKTIQKAHSAGATSFNLIQKKDAWEVTDSPAPPFAAEEDAVNSFLRPWSNLRAEKIAAYGPKIDWAAFGLEKPAQTVSVTVAGDKDKTTEHQLFLGKEADKGLRFARLDKKDEVVVLSAEAAAGLMSTYLDFINRAVLKFDLDTVTALNRQMSGGDMELVKREDSWRFAKPDADKPADDVIVGELLDKLFRLRAERIAAYPVKDLASFGLDKPAAVFTIKLKDIQDIVVEHVIKIGKQTDDKKEERFAVIDKGESVIVLGAELSRRLVAPVLFFADRNLPGFASVDKAVLERPGRKLTFAHGDAGWTLTEPTKADAESADLDELTKSLRRGRAEEIVAQGEDNLKAYGLDRPEAHWHFYNSDKEVMSLLVGNADKEGRRYAVLGRGYQIFTLNPKLSSRLVDEYRSRKPWPALDAVQVEKVTFTSGTSFTLQKKDAGWILPQTPDAKIDTKKVSDTLDALAGLKIIRYVADTNPDLKLYGLDPPVWTIEIETPAGKRTLQIGRQEGDSRRVYATVPGSGAVFIIGDAEAQRILRPLADYLTNEVK